MKIAIYGAGAMGTTLGVFLNKAMIPAELITRNARHVETLRKSGAKVYCSADKREITCNVNALLPEEMSGGYDVIFLMTKQRDNEEIAHFLKGQLKDDGFVCTTQNGLPEEGLARVLGADKVCGCVCTWGANFKGAGEVELTSSFSGMRMEIASLIKDKRKEETLYSILQKVGEYVGNNHYVSIVSNLLSVRFNKLAINTAFSSLSAITGCTFGKIARGKTSRKIALKLMRECFLVQKSLGIERTDMQGHNLEKIFFRKGFLGEKIGLALLPMAVKKHKRLQSGMLFDIQKGRRSEIDFITGMVVKYGEQRGVETPYSKRAVELVRGIEDGLYEITEKNLSFFDL